jgi:hypothetical protein
MENKYWDDEPEIEECDDELEPIDSMTLAKAKKEQDILDSLEEKDNE